MSDSEHFSSEEVAGATGGVSDPVRDRAAAIQDRRRRLDERARRERSLERMERRLRQAADDLRRQDDEATIRYRLTEPGTYPYQTGPVDTFPAPGTVLTPAT